MSRRGRPQLPPDVIGPIPDPGSFRDPASRVFLRENDEVFRGLSETGLAEFEALERSRFFRDALDAGKIVGTRRCPVTELGSIEPSYAAALRHERVSFISYPYEWSFEMLRAAALLTLDLTEEALVRASQPKTRAPTTFSFGVLSLSSSTSVRLNGFGSASRGTDIFSSASSSCIR